MIDIHVSPSAGYIHSMVEAVSDTGGNYAGPGGTVRTGNESASARVTNTNNGQGSSTVQIKTVQNGEVVEKTYTAPSTDVRAFVEQTPKASQVKVQGAASVAAPAAPYIEERVIVASSTVAAAAAAPVLEASKPQNIFARITAWFKGFFSFLH